MRQSYQLSEAELLISREISATQDRVLKNWQGHEKEGLYELVRALDVIAVGRFLRTKDEVHETDLLHEHYCLAGAATALRPFISAIQGAGGGVPFAPTNTTYSDFAHGYLDFCGRLSNLKRFAALEKYGVVRTQIVAPDHLIVSAQSGSPELAALQAMFHLRSQYKRTYVDDSLEEIDWDKLWQRMSSYVGVASKWFIRYDNDWEIVLAYRDAARDFGVGYCESEAFPDCTMLGGRSFVDWKTACEQALGRILCHIDFALLLAKKYPAVDLRNVLTIFVRKDDVAEVWKEAGLRAEQVQPTLDALSLNMDNIDDWENCFETPATYYIDFGKNFYLLPCFGALSNPYFALFRHLRRVYKKEWFNSVDSREQVFREELTTAFPAPRFAIPMHGVKLRRPDGSFLTDIDAVIFDSQTGSIALVQLKWHDVFGRSVREWASRKRNLDEANAWVNKVFSWMDTQTSADVANRLKFSGPRSALPPQVYVLTRYSAAFSGECSQDKRATWLGWPELLLSIEQIAGVDPIEEIPLCVEAYRAQFVDAAEVHETYEFPTLTVELHVG